MLEQLAKCTIDSGCFESTNNQPSNHSNVPLALKTIRDVSVENRDTFRSVCVISYLSRSCICESFVTCTASGSDEAAAAGAVSRSLRKAAATLQKHTFSLQSQLN